MKNGGDSLHHVDPRAQSAIEHLRANSARYVGPILFGDLPALLPIKGDRHCWRDAVAVFLLIELVSVHRVKTGKNPFWWGALYQVQRRTLATRFRCDPDDISSSLQWLKALGLIFVIHSTRTDGLGKPCGTEVFAVPRMDRIKQMLDFFSMEGRPMSVSELMDSDPIQGGINSPSTKDQDSLNDGSALHEKGAYLNCAQTQQKIDDEGSDETSTKQREQIVNGDRRRRVGAGGGGEADDDQGTQVPHGAFASAAPSGHGKEGRVSGGDLSSPRHQGHTPAPPKWPVPEPPTSLRIETIEDREAWQKATRFCRLWGEAVVRLGYISVCNPNTGDHKAAYQFFFNAPQATPYFLMATAIDAWFLSADRKPTDGWDDAYYTRKSLELQSFLRSYISGKVQSQIGQHGIKINAWKDLRCCFTESELISMGWPTEKIPIRSIKPDELWENDSDSPDFYRKRRLRLPPEVAEAERNCKLQEDQSQTASSCSRNPRI